MYKTVTEFSCFIKVQKVYGFPFKALEQAATKKMLWNFLCVSICCTYFVFYFSFKRAFISIIKFHICCEYFQATTQKYVYVLFT